MPDPISQASTDPAATPVPVDVPTPDPVVMPQDVTALQAEVSVLEAELRAEGERRAPAQVQNLGPVEPPKPGQRYLVKEDLGFSDPAIKPAKAGDVRDDIPEQSVPWLLERGAIEIAH